MADTLGLRVIVEGIETPQQAAYFAQPIRSSTHRAGSMAILFLQSRFIACLKRRQREAAAWCQSTQEGAVASAFSA